MADTIEIVVQAVDSFSSVLGNFGSVMTGLESTIHLVADAFKGAYDFSAQFIEAASGSEQAVTKLDTVLKSTNGSFGLTSQQLQDMALNMQNLSGFSDEAEMSAEAMLMRFENLNDIFPQALQLTNDLARSLGIDLTSAAQTIGKALDDPASGIGRLNTQFKLFNETEMETIKTMAENGDIAGAQALIMERLTEKVGGAAQAFGETFAGQVAIAKEKIDNIKESIGGALLPILTDLLSKFNEFVDRPEVIQFFKDLASAISDLASGDLSGIDTFFGNLFQHMADAVDAWVTGGGAEELSNSLVSWIKGIGTSPDTQSKALAAAGNLLQALIDALGAVPWEKITAVIDNKLAGAITAYPWKDSGDAFGNSLLSIFDSAAQTAGADMSNPASSTTKALSNAISQWLLGAMNATSWSEIGQRFFTLFKIGVMEWFLSQPLVIDMIKIGIGTIDILADLYAIGHNIISGIIEGVQDYAGNLWASMKLTLELWIMQIKAFLGVFSPSTVFFGIGQNIMQGLINGFTSLADSLYSAVKGVVADILDFFKPVLDLLGIDTSSLTGGGTTGSHDTGTTTTGGGTTSSVTGASTVTFNFYGTTYINGVPTDGQYDCPPNIVIGGTASQLVPNAL